MIILGHLTNDSLAKSNPRCCASFVFPHIFAVDFFECERHGDSGESKSKQFTIYSPCGGSVSIFKYKRCISLDFSRLKSFLNAVMKSTFLATWFQKIRSNFNQFISFRKYINTLVHSVHEPRSTRFPFRSLYFISHVLLPFKLFSTTFFLLQQHFALFPLGGLFAPRISTHFPFCAPAPFHLLFTKRLVCSKTLLVLSEINLQLIWCTSLIWKNLFFTICQILIRPPAENNDIRFVLPSENCSGQYEKCVQIDFCHFTPKFFVQSMKTERSRVIPPYDTVDFRRPRVWHRLRDSLESIGVKIHRH